MTRSVVVHNNKRMAKTKLVRTQNVRTCQWQTLLKHASGKRKSGDPKQLVCITLIVAHSCSHCCTRNTTCYVCVVELYTTVMYMKILSAAPCSYGKSVTSNNITLVGFHAKWPTQH